MTDASVIAEWPRNARERVRVSLSVFNGRPVVGLRIWFVTDEGEVRPGRDGLTLGVAHLPALADAFCMALKRAMAEGLIADG